MKSKNILLVALFIIICSVSSVICAQESRNLPVFDKLIVSQGITVVYKQAEMQSVIVHGIANGVIDDILTNVNEEGVLEISLREDHNIKKSDRVTVFVESPNLKQIYVLRESEFKASKIEGLRDFVVIQDRNSTVQIDDLGVSNKVDLILAGNSTLKMNKLQANNISLKMRNHSRSYIKEASVEDEIYVRSEGGSFASIGGETQTVNVESDSPKCLDMRNLAYNTIDISENEKI